MDRRLSGVGRVLIVGGYGNAGARRTLATNPIERTRLTLSSGGWLAVVGTGLGLLAGATQIVAGAGSRPGPATSPTTSVWV